MYVTLRNANQGAVLSIEWGGQFCGPRRTWPCALRCAADHRRRPSVPRGSYNLSGCLAMERFVATVKTRLGHAQSTVGSVASFTIMASRIAVSV